MAGTANPDESAVVERIYQQALNRIPWEGLDVEAVNDQGRKGLANLASKLNPNEPKKTIRWQMWTGIAASIVVLLYLPHLFRNSNHHTDNIETKSIYLNDVDPGGQAATLTLSDGKQINLV